MSKLSIDIGNKVEFKNWLIHAKEKYFIELKKAQELPNAFWETYSSFSNTSGGYVILGVEEGNPENNIIGVGNVEKTLSVLWDNVSNKTKVSYRNIENEDVNVIDLDENVRIILIHIKEAPESKKPVYLGDKIENSYIRTGDGDRKVTKDELAAFMRNASAAQDDQIIDNFSIEDLDVDAIISFKEKVNKRYPKKKYLEMSNEKFLVEIGACKIDRTTSDFKIKKGALLFFGKCNAIKEIYPQYHVDYYNRRGNNPRWSDRVTDDEPGDYEMNLYNFYSIVYEKMRMLLQDEFLLDNQQMRIPASDFDEVLREGLVNCIAHADYIQGYPSTKIEVYDGWFRFLNPGKMLVTTKQFFLGGDSRPRNEIVMKLFRMLGASERQGFGGPLIIKTALTNSLRKPELYTDLEKTELKVWSIDLVDSYPDLDVESKVVLRYIIKANGAVSIGEITKIIGLSDYKVRKAIGVLEEKGIISKIGAGPTTKYCLNLDSVEFLTQLQLFIEKMRDSIL